MRAKRKERSRVIKHSFYISHGSRLSVIDRLVGYFGDSSVFRIGKKRSHDGIKREDM